MTKRPSSAHRHSGARRRESRPGQLSSLADQPRVDARLRPDLRAQRRAALASPTGISTPGPSIRLALDDQVPGAWWRSCWLPAVAANRSSLEVGRGKRRLVLEGGSIDTNGAGHSAHHRGVPAQRSAAAQPRREPRATGASFHDYLGIDQVIWLGRGVAGDDTHGHVDDISRFVGPETIVTAVEPDTRDPNHEPLAENLDA
jgi:hypothetical protein